MMALCGVAPAGAGCSKKAEDVGVASTASALTASAANPASTSWHYVIDRGSTTHIDMPGLKEHIKADTSAASGSLEIVPSDLSQSRGLVRVDLTTLSTHTFDDPDKDSTQTKHARTWLEAVADGKAGGPASDGMRWADFAIRSVDGLSAKDLDTVAASRDGSDDVRTVTMTVRGDLLVHGHKLPKDDVVDVSFRYAAGGAPASRPAHVDIRSRQPMRVVLKEHDVSPRDPAGQLLAWTANLISKVADTADVTVALTATPAPP